jgi:hypothetical protein
MGNPRLMYDLSPLQTNEGLQGRWYHEFRSDQEFQERGSSRRASWDNRTSFWLTRPELLNEISRAGFDLVFEQFDNLEPTIRDSMTEGTYSNNYRSTFVGIKLS